VGLITNFELLGCISSASFRKLSSYKIIHPNCFYQQCSRDDHSNGSSVNCSVKCVRSGLCIVGWKMHRASSSGKSARGLHLCRGGKTHIPQHGTWMISEAGTSPSIKSAVPFIKQLFNRFPYFSILPTVPSNLFRGQCDRGGLISRSSGVFWSFGLLVINMFLNF